MTDQEIIDVVKAHQEGKVIQYRASVSGEEWKDFPNDQPSWTFGWYDYRVKPEPKYRPYKNAEELDEAIKEHGGYIKSKTRGNRSIITEYNDTEVDYNEGVCVFYEGLLTHFTWLDGSPCGIKEE